MADIIFPEGNGGNVYGFTRFPEKYNTIETTSIFEIYHQARLLSLAQLRQDNVIKNQVFYSNQNAIGSSSGSQFHQGMRVTGTWKEHRKTRAGHRFAGLAISPHLPRWALSPAHLCMLHWSMHGHQQRGDTSGATYIICTSPFPAPKQIKACPEIKDLVDTSTERKENE